MTKTKSRFVNQRTLAAKLGITDRRVRQLVETFILPEAQHSDGRYDLDLCQDRYELYREGSDADWERFGEDMVVATKATAVLYDRAMADEAKVEDVQRASSAVQADEARFRFYNACRAKSKSEADLWHLITEGELNRAVGGLLYRGMEIIGASGIVDDDGKVIMVMPIYPKLEDIAPAAAKRRRVPAPVNGAA
jgi:hypothetical protein